jgi:hypothetical protein
MRVVHTRLCGTASKGILPYTHTHTHTHTNTNIHTEDWKMYSPEVEESVTVSVSPGMYSPKDDRLVPLRLIRTEREELFTTVLLMIVDPTFIVLPHLESRLLGWPAALQRASRASAKENIDSFIVTGWVRCGSRLVISYAWVCGERL